MFTETEAIKILSDSINFKITERDLLRLLKNKRRKENDPFLLRLPIYEENDVYINYILIISDSIIHLSASRRFPSFIAKINNLGFTEMDHNLIRINTELIDILKQHIDREYLLYAGIRVF